MAIIPSFLLDTNICIYIAKRRPSEVAKRFAQMRPGEVAISVITYGELIYGAVKSQIREQSMAKILSFPRSSFPKLATFSCLNLDFYRSHAVSVETIK